MKSRVTLANGNLGGNSQLSIEGASYRAPNLVKHGCRRCDGRGSGHGRTGTSG
jgi:hypothetical protein